MQQSIENLQRRFAVLTLREQWMAIGTVLLVIWSAWDKFAYQGWQQQTQTLLGEIAAVQKQLQVQQQVRQQLAELADHDPNAGNRQQLSQLQQSLTGLKQQLSLGEKKFVPAAQMAEALQDMLKRHGNLKLIKLETLPPKPFGNNGQQTVLVYRHAMNIVLQGDYFSTLDYLKSLETLPWRIHWDNIDYRVQDYPVAEIQLRVYTLSFEQEWLGV